MKRKALVVIYWENPKSHDLQILLLRRPNTDGGYWQPVTGGVDQGEDFIDGALREAKEESGFRFSKKPKSIGLNYAFKGRWGPAEEVAFSLEVLSQDNNANPGAPPTPTLDPKEHSDFQWTDPISAHKLVPFEKNKEAIFRTAFRPSPIFIDAEGKLFQEGEEITHGRTLELLYRSIERNDNRFDHIDSEFVIHVGGSALPLEVDDTALHIRHVDLEKETISVMSGEPLPLEPSTLEIGASNVLYCQISGIRARFLRPAYYQIANNMSLVNHGVNRGSEYTLKWGGRTYPIRVTT